VGRGPGVGAGARAGAGVGGGGGCGGGVPRLPGGLEGGPGRGDGAPAGELRASRRSWSFPGLKRRYETAVLHHLRVRACAA